MNDDKAVGKQAGDADYKRMTSALELILLLSSMKDAHLGYVRRSGIEQGCFACIASLALGRGMDDVGADDFDDRREHLMFDLSDKEHPTKAGAK